MHELDRILDRDDVDRPFLVHRSTIAASVDDLPDPVGPVTSTIPLRSGTIDWSTSGRPSSSNVGILIGMTRITMAYRRALTEDVDAESRDARQRVRQVCGAVALELLCGDRMSAEQIFGDLGCLLRRQLLEAAKDQLDQLAVRLDLRRAARRKDEVADVIAAGEHHGHQFGRDYARLRRGCIVHAVGDSGPEEESANTIST